MNEYQSKTTNAKLAKIEKLNKLKKAGGSLSNKQHNELLASIATLQDNISALEQSLSQNGTAYTKSQKDLAQNFTTLREILEAGLNVNNIKDIKQAKEIIVSNLKDIPKPVVNTTKTEIPKWLASEKGISKLNDNVIKVVEALIDLEANIKPKQTADEFVPMRRVVRRGNKLEFDDSYWGGSGGGGGSSSGGGTTDGLTDAQLRATPVDVALTTGDIEIGAVELKNGTDDTRATITASNALKVDGSAVTQPVSGTVTATPTGTQNVDVTANTIGLATGAKQDTGNSSLATVAGAVAGSEMQVDVVGALPAGTNAIGKLAANSGVDIGDVDVTSAVSSTFDHGSNRDIDTSAEQITSTSFACKFGVTLKADITNTGIIYIGNSDVTAGTTAATDGFPLSAGETLTLEVTNSNIPYAIASANNQIIYWTAV